MGLDCWMSQAVGGMEGVGLGFDVPMNVCP